MYSSMCQIERHVYQKHFNVLSSDDIAFYQIAIPFLIPSEAFIAFKTKKALLILAATTSELWVPKKLSK